jgi:hypothetical protein
VYYGTSNTDEAMAKLIADQVIEKLTKTLGEKLDLHQEHILNEITKVFDAFADNQVTHS